MVLLNNSCMYQIMRGSARPGRVHYRNVEQICGFRIIVVNYRLSVSVGGSVRLGKWARSIVPGSTYS